MLGGRREIALPGPDIQAIVRQPFRQETQGCASKPAHRVVDPGSGQDDAPEFHAQPLAPRDQLAFG